MSATDHKRNGLSQGHPNYRHVGSVLKTVHFNAEGMSKSKCECLSKILLSDKVDVLALQETHVEDYENSARCTIPGYTLVDAIGHRVYGVATYVRQDIDEISVIHKSCDDNIFVLAVKVSETIIVNVYKPPNLPWPDTVLPNFEHPVLYVGDFNSHHSQWGYLTDDDQGVDLVEWAESNNLFLVYDAKDPCTFNSARWLRGYSPDLCFCSSDQSLKPMSVGRKVLGVFPHSQHRPVLVSAGIQIPLVTSFPRPRWNFNKADWEAFSTRLEDSIRFIPPTIKNYSKFTRLVLSSAKANIPRGYRKSYIPGWSRECEDLLQEFNETGNSDTADLLLQNLDSARREKWLKCTENLDFTRSSRKAWSLLRKLSSGNPLNQCVKTHPDPCDIAKRIVALSKSDHQRSDRPIRYKLNDILKSQQQPLQVSSEFTLEELDCAISALAAGKAAGLDGIFPEFVKHVGIRVKTWLLTFFNNILLYGELPAAFRKSKIVAVLKPGKESDRAESYRPIALLSVTYKLFERLLYNRLSPILNASIPVEQAGFRPGRNCCDQVLALTSFIESGFEKKNKTSAAFLDLSAAYDTVWRKGLLVKLYELIPCPALMRLFNNMLSNRLIKVYIGRTESSFRQLHDGLPQGSVLAPLLFNVYTADIPKTISRKFIYADDIALAVQDKDFHQTEVTLNNDLAILKDYFRTWKLKPNPAKTEVACFHLNNRLANYRLNVLFDGIRLRHNQHPKYLGVTLDRSLTYKSHIGKTAAKVKARASVVQCLAGSSWGANAQVLRTSALSLVYSSAEYCAPVWLNSAHVRDIDVQLNRVMRTISGSVMATPLPWLPVLSNIAPPDIRRKAALLREFTKITATPDLPILQDLPPQVGRLKSRHPPLRTASQLADDEFETKASWTSLWNAFGGPNKFLVTDPTHAVKGMDLPRKEWTYTNRFRTGVGRCNAWKFKWGQTLDQSCDCGEEMQTMTHIVDACPLRSFPGGIVGLHDVGEAALSWLRDLDLAV